MCKKIFLFLVMGIFTFGAGEISLAMMRNNGSEHSGDAHAAPQVASKKPVNVENQICPVGNEKIVESSKATYEYKGKIYNFCCPMCIDEFRKNPDKYAAKAEQDAGSAH